MKIFIDGVLGPGVTVLGSELPHHRRIILEQMAVAISSGEDFLGLLKVERCKVLFIARGEAEFLSFRSRAETGTPQKKLDLTSKWPRLGNGCIRELRQYFETQFKPGVVFLGDYSGIKRQMPRTDGNLIVAQELAREGDYRDIKLLRDLSAAKDVALVLGHDLSTRGQLLYAGSLKHRDNELRIRRVREEWILEVLPFSNSVSADSWSLHYDDELKIFRIDDSQLRRRPDGKLPLVKNEQMIIDALWESGPLTMKQLMEKTKIPYTTLHDRLKALLGKEKGEWIVRLETESEPINYMVDSSKEREWVSGVGSSEETTR
jgi:hypothetical protein